MVAYHGCTTVYCVYTRPDILNFGGIIGRPVFQKVRTTKGAKIVRKVTVVVIVLKITKYL